MREQLVYSVRRNFKDIFQRNPSEIIVSPGRVNLIGDHTDYNLGYVFPAAVRHAVYIAIGPSGSQKSTIYSLEKKQTIEFNLDSKPEPGHWINYVLGALQKIWRKYPEKVQGIKVTLAGDIPQGAGMSSSAAVTCGFAFAINDIFDCQMSKEEIAHLAQQVEHEYVGVKCGLMDQYACLFGKKDHAFLLDCESYELHHVDIENTDYSWILIDSMVKHSLAESAYNERRAESESSLQFLQQKDASILSFKDVSGDILLKYENEMNPVEFKRANHIVSENLRVQKVFFALSQEDLFNVGDQLNKSHRSLKEWYEVTCVETDYIAETMQLMPGVLGARQMGGGFGGCIIALVDNIYVSEISDRIMESYASKFSNAARLIKVEISDGCRKINN
jgi:galactokinase